MSTLPHADRSHPISESNTLQLRTKGAAVLCSVLAIIIGYLVTSTNMEHKANKQSTGTFISPWKRKSPSKMEMSDYIKLTAQAVHMARQEKAHQSSP